MARIDPRELGLKSDSFVAATPDVPQRLIANVEAREKEGKTTFCLTAPDPIIAYNFDMGLEGIAQHALKSGKRVVVAGVDQGRNRMPAYYFKHPKPKPGQSAYDAAIVKETAMQAGVLWGKFKKDYREGLESKAKTLVIDTGGAAFRLNKEARFGRTKRILPRDYDELYQEFLALVQEGYDFDKNVLWIHRLGEEYADHIDRNGNKDSVKTGRWVRKGAYKDMGYEVQANIRLEKTIDKKKETHFKATLVDCRLNRGMDGMEFEDEMCSFPYVAAAVFESEVEDWE